jgi:hypothetical protein
VRQFTERSAAAAEETTKVMEQAYTTASKGVVNFNLQLIEIAQTNMNAAFDFARQLSRVKSSSELVELSTANARKQWDMLTEQTRHLTGLLQKAATDAAQPSQTGRTKPFGMGS